MEKCWWWLPLYLGIPAGVITGLLTCWQSPLIRLYADCRFFRLFTRQLALTIDLHVLVAVAIAAALLACLILARHSPPRLRLLLAILPPLAVLGIAGKLLLPAPAWQALLRGVTDPQVAWYGTLGIALAAMVGVAWRLRRRRASAAVPSPPLPPPRRTPPLLRKAFLALWGVFLLGMLGINAWAAGCWAHAALTVRRQPNIILVMVCSLRADHLGCYGYDLNTSPHLDRFARKSTRFAQAVAPSSWTLWSTASILTSRQPERIFRDKDYVAERSCYPGLPTALSNLGYVTNIVSAHPLLDNDENFHYSQDIDTFDRLGGNDFIANGSPRVTARALARVKQRQGRPFFLYAMYADPHAPYIQHPGFTFGPSQRDALDPRWTASLPPDFRKLGEKRVRALVETDGKYGESRQARLAKYNSEIAYTDVAIGDLFDGLRELGVYDDALIIVCADHGEEFLEHGRYGHQHTLHREVTEVPLLVKAPGQRQAKVIPGRFPLLDLFPSVLTMLRQDDAHLGLQGDGVDIPALLRCTDKPVYGATVNRTRSVTVARQKYLRRVASYPDPANPFDGGIRFHLDEPIFQLFDVRADAGEYDNLLLKAPGTAAALRETMREHDRLLDAQMPSATAHSPSAAEDAKAREQLKSLGYLQE